MKEPEGTRMEEDERRKGRKGGGELPAFPILPLFLPLGCYQAAIFFSASLGRSFSVRVQPLPAFFDA
jgi:hypothetical protein